MAIRLISPDTFSEFLGSVESLATATMAPKDRDDFRLFSHVMLKKTMRDFELRVSADIVASALKREFLKLRGKTRMCFWREAKGE